MSGPPERSTHDPLHLPLPSSNDPAEVRRTLAAAWAAISKRIEEMSSSGTTTTILGGGTGTDGGGGGGGGTPPTDLTDYLLWQEKPSYVNAWTAAQEDKPILDAQAAQAGVSSADYDTAYTNLSNYLTDQPGAIYTVSGTQYKTAGWNTLDRINKYLGPGGRAYWDNMWGIYFREAQKLRDAILNAGVSGGSQFDVIRPLLIWDHFGTNLPTQAAAGNSYNPPNCGPTTVTVTSGANPVDGSDHTYSGFSPSGTTAEKLNYPTQNVVFQTIYQGVYGATPATYTAGTPVGMGYLVVIRCRWAKVGGVGTWTGKVTPTVSSGGTLAPVVVGAIAENQWKTLVWDLRGAGFNSGVNLTGFLHELVDGGTVDIDFVVLGVYGSGSRTDYDNLVSQMATLAMMRADFVDPATGKIPGSTKINPDSITSPLIAAEQIFAKHLTVGNFDNLVINGNSQYKPTPDWTSMGGTNAGIEGVNVSGATGFGGSSRCRSLASQTVVITNPVPVAVGDVYAAYAFVNSASGATGTIVVEYSANGTSGWTNINLGAGASSNAIGWNDAGGGNYIGNSFTVPSGAGFVRVSLTATGGTVYFDNIYLRRCADSRLIIDGGILTRHISAGAVQAWQANFGPNYQFFSKLSGGNPLFQTADGALKRPANSAEWNPTVENPSDVTWYADPNRIYPSGTGVFASRFEATFYGESPSTATRSIIAALDSPFSPGLGLELRRTGTGVALYRVNSIGNYTLVGSETSITNPGVNYEKISLVLYNPVGSAGTDLRAEIYVNGRSVKKYLRADLPDATWGNTWNFGGGYYTGIRLGTTGLKATAIAMGGGNVTIESGIITADMLNVLLALVGVIQSLTYAAPSSGNGWVPQGFKISGQQFNSTLIDGLTVLTDCIAEFGGSINMNGFKLGVVTDRTMAQYNRVQNGRFIAGPSYSSTLGYPWVGVSGTPLIYNQSATVDGTYCVGQRTQVQGDAPGLTETIGIVQQAVTLPKIQPGAVLNLACKTSFFTDITGAGDGQPVGAGRIILSTMGPGETSFTTLATWDYGNYSSPGTWSTGNPIWDARTQDINGSNRVANNPGDWMIRFELRSKVDINCGHSNPAHTARGYAVFDEVSIIA